MSEAGLIQILEGALLAAGKPLTVSQLGDLFEEHERPDSADIREALEQIAQRCEDRGFELLEVASGFRYQVRQSLSPWVARLWQERPQKYSRALLETLALIAYRQPITRGEIEEIRGVAVSSNIVKTLAEREWIRVVGHRDVPGRPAMYATTRQFLDYFNLKTLEQLPALAEIRDLETLNAELGFSEPLPEEGAEPAAEAAAGQPAAENPGLTLVGGTDHTPEANPAQLDATAGPVGELDASMLSEAADSLQAHSEGTVVESEVAAEAEAGDEVVGTEQASAEQASAEQASAEQTSAEQTSAEQASAEQASAEQTSAEQASAEQASAEQASAEQTSAEQTSAEQISAEQTSAEQTSAEQTSAEQASAEQISAEQTSAEQASAEQTSAEQASEAEVAVAQASVDGGQPVELADSHQLQDQPIDQAAEDSAASVNALDTFPQDDGGDGSVGESSAAVDLAKPESQS